MKLNTANLQFSLQRAAWRLKQRAKSLRFWTQLFTVLTYLLVGAWALAWLAGDRILVLQRVNGYAVLVTIVLLLVYQHRAPADFRKLLPLLAWLPLLALAAVVAVWGVKTGATGNGYIVATGLLGLFIPPAFQTLDRYVDLGWKILDDMHRGRMNRKYGVVGSEHTSDGGQRITGIGGN